ncbi:hypothetical protein GQ42DRAFT_138363 [Ramicandelaber brevisporus]|nr:hypothetical protein GQ42DRAFT_138363 [Ramicandelaber brevisporus]
MTATTASNGVIFVDGPVAGQITQYAAFVDKVAGNATFSSEIGESPEASSVISKLIDTLPIVLSAQKVDEKDRTGAITQLFTTIILASSADSESLAKNVSSVVSTISNANGVSAVSKLRHLNSLFNIIESNNGVRYEVFTSIVRIAGTNGLIKVLVSELRNVESWLAQWNATKEQKASLYLLIADQLQAAVAASASSAVISGVSVDLAHSYLVKASAADSSNVEITKRAIRNLIAEPSLFDIDELLQLESVVSLKGSPIYELLTVFATGDVAAFRSVVATNPTVFSELGLTSQSDEENALAKIRMLSLASLATAGDATAVRAPLQYSSIASALQVEESDVEMWVIEAIAAGVIQARIDQLSHTVNISRATIRTFTAGHWDNIGERLNAWKKSLSELLSVLDNAKSTAHIGIAAVTASAKAAAAANV